MWLSLCIACGFPLLLTLTTRNTSAVSQSALLQAMNVQATSVNDCDFLRSVVDSWLIQANAESGGSGSDEFTYTVQWARVLPARCEWQQPNGVITSQRTSCARTPTPSVGELLVDDVVHCFAGETTVRVEEFTHKSLRDLVEVNSGAASALVEFSVDIIFDNSRTVAIV